MQRRPITWGAKQHSSIHICQFKPQLVLMLICFWQQGKYSRCTNSLLHHTEHFTFKCAMFFITTWSTCGNRLRKFSLSVTSSDMAPMDTGSKWTEWCLWSCCKKSAVLEAAPNTSVSQYVGTYVPCEGSLCSQPPLYTQINSSPLNYRRPEPSPTKTTWGAFTDIKSSSICAVLLLYNIITILLFHQHLKVEGIQTSCTGHS